ncbi:CLUMA_CG016362, isoform A, partial [Clunio marinus]
NFRTTLTSNILSDTISWIFRTSNSPANRFCSVAGYFTSTTSTWIIIRNFFTNVINCAINLTTTI